MREQRGHLSAEELRELNEFTVEDERVPSPEQIESNDTIVLPEIQTMTGYIRQHEPFAFSPGECRGSHTFVISPKEMLDEYVRNEEFRKIIDTGRYIYGKDSLFECENNRGAIFVQYTE